jgi:hypothetical protein
VLTSVADMLQWVQNWARSRSIWPFSYALACCGIEMIAAAPAPSVGTNARTQMGHQHCPLALGRGGTDVREEKAPKMGIFRQGAQKVTWCCYRKYTAVTFL